MRNIEISPEIRFQVLWEAGIRTIPKLMKLTRTSRATAFRYAKYMVEVGSIQRKTGSGGHNKIPERVLKKVINKLKNAPRPLSCTELASYAGIGRETARKTLKKGGWSFKKMKNKKLSSKERQKRVDFCRMMTNRRHDIPFILWTDETSFWLNKSRPKYAWVSSEYEENYEGPTGLISTKVHVWGAISSRGTISLSLFEENLNAALYVNILQSKMREINAKFPEGFFFMCDNDPKHKSKVAQDFYQRHFSMEKLDWPSYSPDLNVLAKNRSFQASA